MVCCWKWSLEKEYRRVSIFIFPEHRCLWKYLFTRVKFWRRHTEVRLGIFPDALLQVNIRVTAVRAAPVSSRGRRGSIETVVSDAGKTLARKFIGYSEMNSAGRSSLHIHGFCLWHMFARSGRLIKNSRKRNRLSCNCGIQWKNLK